MNIFVSVGTQLPFERLLETVDSVTSGLEHNVVYQIGDSEFNPDVGTVHRYLDPESYKSEFDRCDLFISHAGMGSIITALENGKPMVIMPRLLKFNEHRNDHQLATASKFLGNSLVTVISNSYDLSIALKQQSARSNNNERHKLNPDQELLNFLKAFIED